VVLLSVSDREADCNVIGRARLDNRGEATAAAAAINGEEELPKSASTIRLVLLPPIMGEVPMLAKKDSIRGDDGGDLSPLSAVFGSLDMPGKG